jgi:hypothetical protein
MEQDGLRQQSSTVGNPVIFDRIANDEVWPDGLDWTEDTGTKAKNSRKDHGRRDGRPAVSLIMLAAD